MSSDVVAELAQGVAVSDPKPSHCAACFKGADADTRFVNFDAKIDRGAIVDAGSMAVIDSIDDLHLCESCVRAGAEALGLKPQLHARQLNEIRRLEIEIEHWKATVVRLRKELDVQIESGLGESPRRRKVAV